MAFLFSDMLKEAGQKHRPLHEIAREIKKEWKGVYFGAKPYLDAMGGLENISDSYICDSGHSIVLYFLSNASTWRGEAARRVKAELKEICKGQ